MRTLRDWFGKPDSPITYDYNAPELSRGIMGQDAIVTVPPPSTLIDISAYPTPYGVLFNRPNTTLTQG